MWALEDLLTTGKEGVRSPQGTLQHGVAFRYEESEGAPLPPPIAGGAIGGAVPSPQRGRVGRPQMGDEGTVLCPDQAG